MVATLPYIDMTSGVNDYENSQPAYKNMAPAYFWMRAVINFQFPYPNYVETNPMHFSGAYLHS